MPNKPGLTTDEIAFEHIFGTDIGEKGERENEVVDLGSFGKVGGCGDVGTETSRDF